MNSLSKNNVIKVLVILFLIVVTCSCETFLETDLNDSMITSEEIFGNDLNAIGAVTGVYRTMVTSTFAGGGSNGIPALTGLSSDEFHNYLLNTGYTPFERNELLAEDAKVLSLWRSGYDIIYQANSVLEGLAASHGVNETNKKQLRGEALFVRGFANFCLVNLFGDVPLMLSTDYKANAKASRQSVVTIYSQVKTDLLEAQSLLIGEYPDTERVRPNVDTVTALLARFYLYNQDWENARLQATRLIENSNFSMVNDLDQVFLKESIEVIWQLASEGPLNTNDGASFVIKKSPGSSTSVLTDKFLSAFEDGDERESKWVGTRITATDTLHYPYKYKSSTSGAPITEHYVVFRLAEQYLIRAEAQAQQNNLGAAIADLDVVRGRAGLALIQDTNPSINQSDLLLAIEHERQAELFTEWGHRWFDLKRTNRADATLVSLKDNWSHNDQLYPIPQDEFDKNTNLGQQNLGY